MKKEKIYSVEEINRARKVVEDFSLNSVENLSGLRLADFVSQSYPTIKGKPTSGVPDHQLHYIAISLYKLSEEIVEEYGKHDPHEINGIHLEEAVSKTLDSLAISLTPEDFEKADERFCIQAENFSNNHPLVKKYYLLKKSA